MSIRNAALSKIHIAKTQLGMVDEDYRAMLMRVAGVTSSTKLNAAGLDAVLKEMVRLGFKPVSKSKKAGQRPNPPASRDALMGKLEAQLAEAGRPWAYADGMAKRMYGVDKCDWLDGVQLQGLIAAMYRDAQRHGRVTR